MQTLKKISSLKEDTKTFREIMEGASIGDLIEIWSKENETEYIYRSGSDDFYWLQNNFNGSICWELEKHKPQLGVKYSYYMYTIGASNFYLARQARPVALYRLKKIDAFSSQNYDENGVYKPTEYDRLTIDDSSSPSNECDCEGSLRKEYYYRPKPIFYHTKGEKPSKDSTFGIELEFLDTEVSSFYKKLTQEEKDLFYFKYDGSIGEYGVECVSHPFTKGYYKAKGKAVIESLCKKALVYGDTSTETGLHIHIGRGSLSESDICKLYYFINSCEEVKALAGRHENEYFRYHKSKKIFKSEKEAKDTNRSRYSALNLEPNKTVEVRIFVNSHAINKTLGRIEFIITLIDFLKVHDQRKLSFSNYINWLLSKEKDNYPNLFYLITHSLNKL